MKKIMTTLFAAIFPLVMMAQGWPAKYTGVMLQSFIWDDYSGTSWQSLTSRADELSNCFDLIWVPNSGQTAGGAGARDMGYMPCYYFNQNTIFGTEEQLRNMISTYKSKGTGFIADVVINHKNGKTNWIDFPNESYGSYSVNWNPTQDICRTDECNRNGYSTSGANDTGDDFDGCRDLDHTSSRVQENMITYQKFLLNEIGYVGVRLDMVKGYGGQYTKIYNQASNPTFSVGEYWDGDYNAVMGWINATGKTSAAFDFPLKYVINNAVGNGNYGALSNKGIAGDPNNSRYSVTFVDNHDTGRDGNAIAKDWSAGNAVILALPGTPCVWMRHYNADKTNIKNMIYARRAAGVHNQSNITKGEYSNGGYIIETQGTNGKVYVQLGGATNNGTPSGMKLVAQGDNYKFYCTSSLDITTPHKPGLPGGGGGDDPLPTGKTTIHIKAASAPTLYAWSDANGTAVELNGGWPGTTMTVKDNEGFWVKTFDTAPVNIVINNGSGLDSGKTPDITGLSGDVYYEYDGATTATATTGGGGGGGGGGQTGGSTTVHVKANSAPYLYAWTDAGALTAAWPGDLMTDKDAEGFWVKTFSAAPINIIFNNGNGAQTDDITGVSGNVYYIYDGATTATATTGGGGGGGGGGQTGGSTTVHVKANSAPYLYAWTDAGALTAAWPGDLMTEKDSEGFWVKTFNASPINIIFNNGSGAQTDDITGVSGNVYYIYDGASSATVTTGGGGGGGQTGGTTTVYVQATSTPYLYAWTDTDFSVNGLWPGSAMSPATNLPAGAMAHVLSANGSWYVATLNASPVNVIINDGTGDDSGKTSDITGLSGENYFIYDGATGYEITSGPQPTGIDEVAKIYFETGDVYSIDGQLVRKSEMAGEAMKNLKKGIYIINGKKVVVK